MLFERHTVTCSYARRSKNLPSHLESLEVMPPISAPLRIVLLTLFVVLAGACGARSSAPTTPNKVVEMEALRIVAKHDPAGSYSFESYDAEELFRRAKDLSRLLKNEFIYEPGRPFEANVDDAIGRLLQWGVAEKRPSAEGEVIAPLSSGLKHLLLLSELLRPYGEAVWLAADALGVLKEAPLDPKEWSRRALDRGRAAFLAGRLRRSESLSKALLDNALAMYRDRGVVVQGEGKGGKLSLGPGYTEAEKLHELTAEVDVFFN